MTIRHVSEESVNNGNFPIPDVPDGPTLLNSLSPTNIVITNGTGIISLPYTAPTGGVISSISSVASNPVSGISITSTTSSAITINGSFTLAAGTPYYLSARASNSTGTSNFGSQVEVVVTPSRSGYFCGGDAGAGVTTIDRFSFPTDSRVTLLTGINVAMGRSAGMANSGVAGYTAGGFSSGSEYSTVNKILFSNESLTTITALSSVRYECAAFANSGTAGYVAGTGTVIDKYAFPSDTRSTLTATLSTARTGAAGMANSGTAGYAGGGTGYLSSIDKLTFSSEAISTLSSTLHIAKAYLGAMANKGSAGYFAGGWNGSYQPSIDRILFSDDTRSTLGTSLSVGVYYVSGMANNGIAGYFGGGYVGGGAAYTSFTDKLSFSGESRTTLATGLSSRRYATAAFANSGII